MKKFNVEVTRTDEYNIEIDEAIWNEKALADWSSCFWPLETIEDLAKAIGEAFIRTDIGDFIEGFGVLKVFYSNGNEATQFVKETADGIVVHIVSHDNNYDTQLSR